MLPAKRTPVTLRGRGIVVDRAKRLSVGEPFVRIVLNQIVRVNPAAPVPHTMTLPIHGEESWPRST